MKTFAGAMVSFIIIMAGVNIYSACLTKTVNSMEEQVDEIMDLADKEDWEACRGTLSDFTERWHSTQQWFTVFIHHDKILLISEVLHEIEMYVRYENREQTVARSNVLKNQLQSIPENERLTLQNVL